MREGLLRRVGLAYFARRLRLHAQQEEVLLYPAAILVGQVVQQRLNSKRSE